MKLKLFTCAIGLMAISAHAELGDNYATMCKERSGRQGLATKDQWVHWAPANETGSDVLAQFRNNRCQAIMWSFPNLNAFAEGEIWRTLVLNSHGARWSEYQTELADTRCFACIDNPDMVAWLSEGKLLHLAYKSWVDRHHMWTDRPDYEGSPVTKKSDALPPVEDSAI
jgi:hypothetical protein